MRPFMSIIIPAYNEEKFIGRLLDSIESATKRLHTITDEEIELIVVDNASDDQTAEIAKSYGAKIVFEPVHNIARVRNTGFIHSDGEVVVFSDADNIISENALIEIYKTMKNGRFVGGGMKFRWDRNNLFYKFMCFGVTVCSHIIGMTGVLLYTYREVFEEIGGFNESFFCGEDLLFARVLKHEAKHLGLHYRNIYNANVITSARRFNKMKFHDIFHFLNILLKPSLMKVKNNCSVWYSLNKR